MWECYSMYNALHIRYNIPAYLHGSTDIGVLFRQSLHSICISCSDNTTNEDYNNEIPNISTNCIHRHSNGHIRKNGTIR